MSTQQLKFRNTFLAAIALLSIGSFGSSLLSSAAMAQTAPTQQMPCRRVIESPFRWLTWQQTCQSMPVNPQTPPVQQGQSTAPINPPGDSAQPSLPNPPQQITPPVGSTLPIGLQNPQP
jgi:hypothetical protein